MTKIYHKSLVFVLLFFLLTYNVSADSTYYSGKNETSVYDPCGEEENVCLYVISSTNYIVSVYEDSVLVHELIRNIGVTEKIDNSHLYEFELPYGNYTVIAKYGYFDNESSNSFHIATSKSFILDHIAPPIITITKTVTINETNVINETKTIEETNFVNETNTIDKINVFNKTTTLKETEIRFYYITNTINQTNIYSSVNALNSSGSNESNSGSFITPLNAVIISGLAIFSAIIYVKRK